MARNGHPEATVQPRAGVRVGKRLASVVEDPMAPTFFGRKRRATWVLPVLLVAGIVMVALAYAVIYQRQNGGPQYLSVTDPVCGTWEISYPSASFGAVSAKSTDSVWFAGATNAAKDLQSKQRASFARWDGSRLNPMPGPDSEKDVIRFNGLATRNQDDAWAVGYSFEDGQNEVLSAHWDGNEWALVAISGLPPNYINPITGVPDQRTELSAVTTISENDVWAVGHYVQNRVSRTLTLHWDGTQWTIVPSPNIDGTDNYLYAVVSPSPGDLWAFGFASGREPWEEQPITLHWTGESWVKIENPMELTTGITAASATPSKEIWVISGVVGNNSLLESAVRSSNGNQWTRTFLPKLEFPIVSAISALSLNDVWVVGNKRSDYPPDAGPNRSSTRSLVLHWNGTAWAEVPGPDPSYIQSLDSVVAADKDDIWVIGTSSEDEDAKPRAMLSHFVGCSGSAK